MSNFKALEPEITPGDMEIKGTRSKLAAIVSLKTAPVSIQGANEDVVGETSVILPDDGSVHAVKRSTVQYRIPLVRLDEDQGNQSE